MKMQQNCRLGLTISFLAFCSTVVSVDAEPKNVAGFKAPAGYTSVTTKKGTYSRFVQTLPLKEKPKILTWEGKENNFQGFDALGVVKLPILYKQDLEQCADWAMRFWAEHYKAKGALESLVLYNYDGSKKPFRSAGQSYKEYLRLRMAYSNSHSLKKGSKTVTEPELVPGDMIVQNETGGIGHVSVIMNVAKQEETPDLYLIGFSFMPAQEFHIERAAPGYGLLGWFTMDGFRRYLKERLDLGEPVFRRFPE